MTDMTNWNADDWHLFLCQHLDNRVTSPNGLATVALAIADSIDVYRNQLVLAKEALTDIEEGTECGWARGRARKALRALTDEPECWHEDYCLHPKCECAKTDENKP